MNRPLKWLAALLVLIVLGAALGRVVSDRRADPAQPQAQAPQAGVVLELAPADLVTASRRELSRTLSVSGSLQAVETAVVKAKVAAEVRELNVRAGHTVKAGQVLGRLDATEYRARLEQARQQAASASAQLAIAERTLEDNRALVGRGYISRNALDTSVANAAAARATLMAARAAADIARKAVDDTVLRAPIGGQVSQRLVQPGERVAVDARLLEIVDLSQMELEAPIAAGDLAGLPIGAPASLRIDGVAQPVAAHLARINPSAQAGTRAVLVYLEIAPQPALRHGLFATGQIELGRLNTLAVPESSVRTDRIRPYVLAIQGDSVVQREVELGGRGRAGDPPVPMIAITGGLAEGALVLAGRVGLVPDGTPVRLGAVLPQPQPAQTPGAVTDR